MAAILSRPHCVFVFVFDELYLYLYLYLYLIRFLPVYLYLYLYLKLPKKMYLYLYLYLIKRIWPQPCKWHVWIRGDISRSNIGITWGHGWMALLAKHTKLIILCLHAKKLIYHVKSQNDDFVSKYPSSVAAILKSCFRDQVTLIFQPTPISDPGP